MTSRRATRTRAAGRTRPGATLYWDATPEPLYCLVFLLPFVAAYEFGAVVLRPSIWTDQRLVAQALLEWMIGWIGPVGFWAPGVALIITLAAWHIMARRSWQIRAWIPALMLVESALLTLPLFVIGGLFLQALDVENWRPTGPPAMKVRMVLSLGAGIYEELVFRLYLITLLGFLLVDVARLPRQIATGLCVVLSATIFSLAHIHPIGADAWSWTVFWLRWLAGAYLSLLFVTRGLGVSAGCHILYNLTLIALDVR